MMKYVKSRSATRTITMIVLGLMLSHMTAFATEIASGSAPEEVTASDGRPLYTEETRPDFPVFNSLVGEENFLSIVGPSETVSEGSIELQLGEEYEVIINYDNNGNPRGVRTQAIANDTKVQVAFPFTITNERTLTATISARDSQPESVSSSLTLVANEPMALEVIQGTARIINETPTNNSTISTDKLFNEGAPIGTNSMIGIVLYGSENAGQVVFKFRTVSLGQATATPVPTTSAEIINPAPTAKPTTSNTDSEWTSGDYLGLGVAIIALIAVSAYFAYTCQTTGKKD